MSENKHYTDITDGDKVIRTFHKLDYSHAFEGNPPFSVGDVAVYKIKNWDAATKKLKGKWSVLELHSFNDEPAIIFTNGTKKWFIEGREGRMNNELPAIEFNNGSKIWIDYESGKVLKTEFIKG